MTTFQCELCGEIIEGDEDRIEADPDGGTIAHATCGCGGDAWELDDDAEGGAE